MQNTKVIAMYLPQYHRTIENDTWWGEGFTDWVAVKGARPLFDGHEQPCIPADEYYYDLLDKKTMQWQAELMHAYGIDGMCIYHYWFKDGRKILEKPMENLLQWQDIDMPFCVCWANETWARSWLGLPFEKNTWADSFEPAREADEVSDGILLQQDYGDRGAWEKHFEYLLPFFYDPRYIRRDGKPVFLIYRVGEVECLSDMLQVFRELAVKSGLPGLYMIGGGCKRELDGVLDGQLYLEPKNAIRLPRYKIKNGIRCLLYEDVWDDVISTVPEFRLQPYFGGFVGYDDTPRRGKEGIVVEGTNPNVFRNGVERLLWKNQEDGSDFLFINAWNEWGEGMHLEPDDRWGMAFLQAVKDAKEHVRAIDDKERLEKGTEWENIYKEKYTEIREWMNRIDCNLSVMDKWLLLMEQKKSLAKYIRDTVDGKIYVYGYGILGKHLVRELIDNEISVEGVIDRESSKVHLDIPVFFPDDKRESDDTVIVTVVFEYEAIADQLRKNGAGKVYSLEEMVLSCLR